MFSVFVFIRQITKPKYEIIVWMMFSFIAQVILTNDDDDNKWMKQENLLSYHVIVKASTYVVKPNNSLNIWILQELHLKCDIWICMTPRKLFFKD